MYMEHCKVLIEPIAKSKDKKKGMKADKVVHVEREEETDPEVEMMVRRRWKKEANTLVMRCFYQSHPTRRGYRKQMIAIWREKGTSEITEQRFVDQAGVIQQMMAKLKWNYKI